MQAFRVFMVAIVVGVLAVAGEAGAWGKYTVTRPGCGTNGIESGASGGLAWARTWNISCQSGPLGAATRYSNGTYSGIAWAYTQVWSVNNPAWAAVGGAHWGCVGCNVSHS